MEKHLDIQFVRQHFPAYDGETRVQGHFFESAGGSFPCQETIEALDSFYRHNKIQPGYGFPLSQDGMDQMLLSKQRWAEALGVKVNEVGFGPSTSQNTYVLANAFRELLKPGDEVIVTNQDHESNTGAIRRAVETAGATLKEWQVDPESGLLSIDDLQTLIGQATRLVCFPHCSNITGQKNDAKSIIKLAHDHGAWTLVDGVSYVPHIIPDIGSLDCDIYVFSLYKVYSVHQGLMVIRESLLEQLPKQGHYFKSTLDVNELLVPAGPDHAQIAAARGVLDYIETLAAHHGGPVDNLRASCEFVSALWQRHEIELIKPLLEFLGSVQSVRVLGSLEADSEHCPLVSFAPSGDSAADLAHILWDQDLMLSHGHYYAPRLLHAVGLDPDAGVVRVSMAHYNDMVDVQALVKGLEPLL